MFACMKKNIPLLICLLFTVFYFDTAFAQSKEAAWDNATNKNWSSDFLLVQIRSSVDNTIQNAWYHQRKKTVRSL